MGVVVVLGIGLRAYTPSALWLDEAISVAIGRLPLHQLPAALRQDGSPPLYYVLLHFWIRAFGQGDVAVRSLSGLFSVLTMPVIWLVGRRLGGRPLAVAATMLLASSPFAIYFATEARMYSLVMLLAALLALAVLRTLARPNAGNALLVAVVSGALLLTHYWSVFLLAMTCGWLLWHARREAARRQSLVALVGVVAGLVFLIPWLPELLFQLRHTGTPWAKPTSLLATLHAIGLWSVDPQTVTLGPAIGWPTAVVSRMLETCLVVLVVLAVGFHARTRGGRLTLALRGRPVARDLAVLGFGGVALGVVASVVFSAGYQPRYSAPMFVLLPPLAGLGTAALSHRLRLPVLVAVAVIGLVASSTALTNHRKTQAAVVASALRVGARPGDVVVYCPDQLGPAVSRLVAPTLVQDPFPADGNPARVDWVDYAQRNQRADVAAFAAQVRARAAGHAIWMVEADGYATFGTTCRRLIGELSRGRRATVLVHAASGYYERENLLRFTAPLTR